jgi:hypothetical protein
VRVGKRLRVIASRSDSHIRLLLNPEAIDAPSRVPITLIDGFEDCPLNDWAVSLVRGTQDTRHSGKQSSGYWVGPELYSS